MGVGIAQSVSKLGYGLYGAGFGCGRRKRFFTSAKRPAWPRAAGSPLFNG